MATFHGNDGVVKSGAATIAKVKGWTYDETGAVARDDAMGDTVETNKAGKKGGAGTLDCLFDAADTTGQETLTVGSTVTVSLYPAGESGDKFWTGDIVVTGMGAAGNDEGIPTRKFTYVNTLTWDDVS